MKQRTKYLLCICIELIILIIMICVCGMNIINSQNSINQSDDIQIEQKDIPIIYDTPSNICTNEKNEK